MQRELGLKNYYTQLTILTSKTYNVIKLKRLHMQKRGALNDADRLSEAVFGTVRNR